MMRIADVIMELQQKPIENVMVAVVEMPRGSTARRLRACTARGAAYEYDGGIAIFRADVPSLDVELNDELTIYASIAYPMPVKGLRTMLDASALTDTEGCYCGTCMNARIAHVVESIRR